MPSKRKLLSCPWWALSIVALSLIAAPAAGAVRPLLRAAPAPASGEGLPDLPNVLRSRFVRIDATLLEPPAIGELELNLFADAVFTVGLEPTGKADTWRGTVIGDPPGTFTMIRRGDRYAASLRVPGQPTYRIRSIGNGLYLVQEVDEAALAPCGNDDTFGVALPGGAGAPGGVALGGPPVIDVMVVYTPSVTEQLGSEEAVAAEIDLFVAEANGAYANSQIDLELNLVYAGEVNYDDSEGLDHLSLLTDAEDGYMDVVHGLRYNHQADMVSLLVTQAPYCGVAWLMWSNSTYMDRVMFSVTVVSCGGLVFAHELGHNMGCCHAPGDGGGCQSGGLYDYSVGYRYNGDSGTLWRTVMAYSPGLQIPHFSNPGVSYDGDPTGVPGEADNALTITQTSPTIAAMRGELPYCGVTKITASDGEEADSLGTSMAAHADTVLAGAPFDNDNGMYAGSAYVYGYDAGLRQWVEQEKLLADDGASTDLFGLAVALDGGVAVIGAPLTDDNGEDSGAAYVFRYAPGSGHWVQEAKLLASDGAVGDFFGYAVAVSGDVAVVGTPFDDDGGTDSGSAYVFGYDAQSGQWTQQQKVLASDGTADYRFGTAVAAAGDVIMVGAPAADASSLPGAAYCFEYDGVGSAWFQQEKIVPPDSSSGDGFGMAVALDGDAMIIGASAANGEDSESGAAYVYGRNGSIWTQQAKLMAGDGASGDGFGESVALAGNLILVGAPFEHDFGVLGGAVYAFRSQGGGSGWTQTAKLLSPDGARFDMTGSSVVLHGTTALIGVAGDNEQGGSAGALFAFRGYSGVDCNDNGQDDVCEIIAGDAADLNGNDVPDECDVIGDLDGDGTVGVNDFLLLLQAWGACGDCGSCLADLDGDCTVGINDFLTLLSFWG
jgi:hypothetical protein